MANGVTFRLATELDVEVIARLSQRWAAEGSTHGVVPTSVDVLASHLGPYFWSASRGRDVVGFVYGSARMSDGLAVIPAGEPYLEIEELYVVPEHRSGGIGRELVTLLLHTAAENGINRGLVYSASRDWRRMVRFYEQFEFKVWYVQMYR